MHGSNLPRAKRASFVQQHLLTFCLKLRGPVWAQAVYSVYAESGKQIYPESLKGIALFCKEVWRRLCYHHVNRVSCPAVVMTGHSERRQASVAILATT